MGEETWRTLQVSFLTFLEYFNLRPEVLTICRSTLVDVNLANNFLSLGVYLWNKVLQIPKKNNSSGYFGHHIKRQLELERKKINLNEQCEFRHPPPTPPIPGDRNSPVACPKNPDDPL